MAFLLQVSDLRTYFKTQKGIVKAVDGVSFTVERGQTVGVVGESGCGKSTLCRTIIGLNDVRSTLSSGNIVFKGDNLLTLPRSRLRRVRGNEISMIFQDPMTSLNPVRTIGSQLVEAVTLHQRQSNARARALALHMLEAVGIPESKDRFHHYPHQFSGGMRQRVMIAMALINNPDLLIADEPTTALDVTTQAQILDLLRDLQCEFGTAILLVTHDLGVIAQMAAHVVVMYAGKIVETAPVKSIFRQARHPYTEGLLRCMPRLDERAHRLEQLPGSPPSLLAPPHGCPFHPRCPHVMGPCLDREPALLRVGGDSNSHHRTACHLWDTSASGTAGAAGGSRPLHNPRSSDSSSYGAPPLPSSRSPWILEEHTLGREVTSASGELLIVRSLRKYFSPGDSRIFRGKSEPIRAVDGVSFSLKEGETLGIVGESGCGKSTLARCILRLLQPTGGQIVFMGKDITSMSRTALRPIRRHMMMIFQDPLSSLNGKRRIGLSVEEGLQVQRIGTPRERKQRVQELLEIVGLRAEDYHRFPHEFSGGQLQRIVIARALAVRPRLVVCDEPVSALDVSVQAQILNLLKDLQHEFKLSYIVISHDLSVVRYICDRVLVMYLGRIVEVAHCDDLYGTPRHPYTAALMSSVPIPDPGVEGESPRIILRGDVPSAVRPPAGCKFHPRCPKFAHGKCDAEEPTLTPITGDHLVACHYPLEHPVYVRSHCGGV